MWKRIKRTSLLAVFCMVLCGAFFGYQALADAGGASGGGGGGENGNCKKTTVVNWWNDECFGVTWRIYPVENRDIPIYNEGSNHLDGTVRGKDCAALGATHYYRLGYEKFRGTYGNYYSLGSQSGLVEVKKVVSAYFGGAGRANFKVTNGSKDWKEVYSDWQKALERKATFNTEWKDTAWFCWNEKWSEEPQNADSSFDAWSYVGTSSTTSNMDKTAVKDSTVTRNITTQADKITVYFAHQFSYNKPAQQGTYGPAHTNWRTEVSVDDRTVSSTQTKAFTLNNSGANRNSIWDNMDILGQSSREVEVPKEGSVKVCSKIFYQPKYIKWNNANGKFTMDNSGSSGNEDSEACAIISREEVEEEEAGQIRFISRSSVSGENEIKNHTVTSDDNGDDTVTLYLSTDKETMPVYFWHDMRYLYESQTGGAIDPIKIPPDEFVNAEYIKTNYTVTRSSEQRSDANQDPVATGEYKFKVGQPNGVNFEKVNGKNQYTINNLKVGETVKICERINFKNAIFPLKKTQVLRHEAVYSETSTYQGLTLYTRKDNPRYDPNIKYNSESKYIYTAASLYHRTWHEPVYNSNWELIRDGYYSYDSGAVLGDTVYIKTGSGNSDSDYTTSGIYTMTYNAVSTYDDVNKNDLGYYIQREATGKDAYGNDYTYYTYSKTGPYYQGQWHDPVYNSNWEVVREGYYDYIAGYPKGADGKYNGGAIYGPGGQQLYEPAYELVHDHWKYEPIEGADKGEGWSEACISVTRPEEPAIPAKDSPNDTLDDIDGPYSGNPSIGFLYAGESTTDVKWNVTAASYLVRRIMSAQAILYQPKVNVQSRDDIATGTSYGSGNDKNWWVQSGDHRIRNNTTDPCSWYTNKLGGNMLRTGCVTVNDNGLNESWPNGYLIANQPVSIHTKDRSVDIVVPDNVGDKLCNSYGYQLAFWWGYTHTSDKASPKEHWEEEGSRYWAIYDAACRTIVKKPSLNIWNGSLFTNGDVQTAVANRYLNPTLGSTTRNSGENRKFGSWSEYLAVVGGEVKTSATGNFGSGSSFSYRGLWGGATNLLEIHPLTIANANSPAGNSYIDVSSTFRARLVTYLASLAEPGSPRGLQNITETKIIDISGDPNITEDITLKTDSYPSVHQLPQIILYAGDSDVNIYNNVTQIDAWIITNGTLNTCKDFTNHETEAHIKDYNGDTDCSKQLVINGPIIAQNIELNRSYGSDPITYDNITVLGAGTNARAISGEVFNLSADAYLWAYAQAGRYDSSYTEAYTRELPPRY